MLQYQIFSQDLIPFVKINKHIQLTNNVTIITYNTILLVTNKVDMLIIK